MPSKSINQSSMRHHAGVSIDAILKDLSEQKESGMEVSTFSVSGRQLTVDEAIARFGRLKAKGYEELPSNACDNYDEHGRCRGH